MEDETFVDESQFNWVKTQKEFDIFPHYLPQIEILKLEPKEIQTL